MEEVTQSRLRCKKLAELRRGVVLFFARMMHVAAALPLSGRPLRASGWDHAFLFLGFVGSVESGWDHFFTLEGGHGLFPGRFSYPGPLHLSPRLSPPLASPPSPGTFWLRQALSGARDEGHWLAHGGREAATWRARGGCTAGTRRLHGGHAVCLWEHTTTRWDGIWDGICKVGYAKICFSSWSNPFRRGQVGTAGLAGGKLLPLCRIDL